MNKTIKYEGGQVSLKTKGMTMIIKKCSGHGCGPNIDKIISHLNIITTVT